MGSMADLRGREHKSKDGDLDLLGEEFRMKICIELCRSLTAVEKGRVMSCDKSNSCSVPLGFIPLMICDITLVVLHNLVHAGGGLYLTNSLVCKNAVKDVLCCAAASIASGRFLIHCELFFMNGLICPLQWVDVFHLLVVVVHDYHIWSKCSLDCLHPVGVDDAWCNFVLCGSRVNKTEFEHF